MEKWISRRKILAEACERMIKEMFMRAQPPVDIDIYKQAYKLGLLTEKDKFFEWHYLPEEIQLQIIEDYLNAYSAQDHMDEQYKQLVKFFKEGGMRDVYKDVFGNGEKIRTGEETEKLHELIGEENAEKVYKLMDELNGFYRTNLDECTIRWQILNYSPTSNPQTVIEKWGDKVKIDDSVYKGYDNETWDYTYKDYYNGETNNWNDELD